MSKYILVKECFYCDSDLNFTLICNGQISTGSSLVQVMDWHPTGNNWTNADPAYWRIYASADPDVLKCVTIGADNGLVPIWTTPYSKPLLILAFLNKTSGPLFTKR